MGKKNTTIKTDMMALVNAHSERNARIRKEQAEERKERILKNAVLGGIGIGCVLFALGLGIVGENDRQSEMWNVYAESTETEQTETETITTTSEHIRTMEAVLVDINDEGNYIIRTEDEHEWEMQDAPEVWYTLEIYDNETPEDVTDDVVVGLYE